MRPRGGVELLVVTCTVSKNSQECGKDFRGTSMKLVTIRFGRNSRQHLRVSLLHHAIVIACYRDAF